MLLLCVINKPIKHKIMKAIIYQQFGGREVLKMVDQAKPVIGPNDVLVKVKAFSINAMDWKIRKGEMKLMSGSRFPKHTGADFSGIIENTGTRVTGLQPGDAVFGVVNNLMKQGVSAEYIAVPASMVWPKPAKLNFSQAASIPVVGTAALTTIQKIGRIKPGTEILVNGATGGFGMFLIQLLKDSAARITAVTSTQGVRFARSLGADSVIDYTLENVLDRKAAYDVVIDLSGKMGYKMARSIMKDKALFLNPTPKPIEIPGALIRNLFTGKKHIVILSSPSTPIIQRLLKAVDQGLQIEISRTFPFGSFLEAYQYAERGSYVGKITIELD